MNEQNENGQISGGQTISEQTNCEPEKKKEPLRYNLYSGLKGRVSLRTMDIIISVISIALIVLLYVGIFGK